MNLPIGFLPVLSLKKIVMFPGQSQVVRVGRSQNVAALESAKNLSSLSNKIWIVASLQKTNHENDKVNTEDLSRVGTLCIVDSIKGDRTSGYQIMLKGIQRSSILNFKNNSNFIEADISHIEKDLSLTQETSAALVNSINELAIKILSLASGSNEHLKKIIISTKDLEQLVDVCAMNFDFDPNFKQEILSIPTIKERALKLLNVLSELKVNLELQVEIQNKMHQKLGKNQREGILREQLKTIKAELGEEAGDDSLDVLKQKLESCGIDGESKKSIDRDFRRLKEMGPQSPESQMLRNYLELVSELPWDQSEQAFDVSIDEAELVLNQDHSGLDSVKKRILQHLAVMKLQNKKQGSILLLVGPPGVGKTSLAQSIAKTLGKKLSRVSLGGVRDESDIRGHRRTYIGSMPGRIIQSLRRTNENDTVILLDEIDKLGRGYSGDPAAALLEVLDPEQNSKFTDHYLDLPFDLSKIFFIATANSLEGIPGPLLDRLEVIPVSSYTVAEKFDIAKKHLLRKEYKQFNIKEENFKLSDELILHIIQHYTREAGVRDLKRKLDTIFRHASLELAKEQNTDANKNIYIDIKNLDEILGPAMFRHDLVLNQQPPGVATGLAWSPVGGDILFIESTAMSGSGQILITGQLGDVMKESAKIAHSLIRRHLHDLQPKLNLEKYDLHIHVPSGATPKDGPSAGITLFTSIASLLSHKSVRPELAMTGELTLRGAVTPVGGIKEKVLAAHRAGIREIVFSKQNEQDLRDIPNEILRALKFHFVSNISEVLEIALDIKLSSLNPWSFNPSTDRNLNINQLALE